MLTIGLYLLKVSMYIIAFYIPYLLVFRRTTFFGANRAYLLLGLVLSFGLPFCNWVSSSLPYPTSDFTFIEPILSPSVEAFSVGVSNRFETMNSSSLLVTVYAAGVVVRFSIFLISLLGLVRLRTKSEAELHEGIKIFNSTNRAPFSFFRWVFLPGGRNDSAILAHEIVHVKQYHWIDLLVVELSSMVLWFNPIMWLYKRSIKQVHEYLADHSATKITSLEHYLRVIRAYLSNGGYTSMVSEMNATSIKNRIHMLTKKKTSIAWLPIYALGLPAVFFLLMSFGTKEAVHAVIQVKEVVSGQGDSFGLPIDKDAFSLASGYGMRMHPVLKEKRMHTGIDLIAEEGVAVVAAQEGVVVKAEMAHAWGNLIVIKHDDIYSTSYSHMKLMKVQVGENVKKGQVIGLVGHTGLSAKNHLHFELLKNGKAIDPEGFLPLNN